MVKGPIKQSSDHDTILQHYWMSEGVVEGHKGRSREGNRGSDVGRGGDREI